MFVEDPFLNSIIWFFSGVLSHKGVAAVLKISRAISLFREVTIFSLSLLRVADSHMELAREVKYKALKNAGEEITEEELEKLKRYDETFVQDWRSTAVRSIITNSPDYCRGFLNFKSWYQAMNFLDKERKKKGF
tara:strand:- start:1458 stop:1859 length:402 start_codon:yes stop_codon:yes gene_type:complete